MLQDQILEAIEKIIMSGGQPGRRKDPETGKTVCLYCGCTLNEKNREVDHIHPLSKGGIDAWFNKVLVCRRCNTRKNGLHPVYWLMKNQAAMPDGEFADWMGRLLYHYLTVKDQEEVWPVEGAL